MHTVLVVDDSRNIREFCGRELEKCGYRVRMAASGEEALEVCGFELPDVVILDVRMPGLDGLETMQRLAGRHPSVPVILHTAHRADLSLDFRSWPARACVEKTDDLADLKRAVARVLDERSGS